MAPAYQGERPRVSAPSWLELCVPSPVFGRCFPLISQSLEVMARMFRSSQQAAARSSNWAWRLTSGCSFRIRTAISASLQSAIGYYRSVRTNCVDPSKTLSQGGLGSATKANSARASCTICWSSQSLGESSRLDGAARHTKCCFENQSSRRKS